MRKIVLLFYCSIVLLFYFLLPIFHNLQPVYADELKEIERQIAELEKARQQSISATTPLEKELNRLEIKLENVQAGIKKAEENLIILEASIVKRENDFERQYVILAERVESYYKNLRQPSGFLTFLSSQRASTLTKDLAYRQVVADEDKKIISQISNDLLTLENDKKKAEGDKEKLAFLKQKTDEQAAFFRKEVKGAKDYQTNLSSKIATLTAKQQQLLAQRLGSLNLPTSLGAGPLHCTDDRKLNPGFSPAFAFYTYGIPHRVGMNQYGAYGRAKAGQNHEQILRAYFNADFGNWENKTIKVQGYSPMPLEQYMLGIYEVPDSWGNEGAMAALEAQAVAARSYVLAYTNNGVGEICTTQACQVYKGGNKGGNWEQAVKKTAGKVMVSGGQPIKAWYASTSGGYTFTSGDVWGGGTSWTKRLRDTNGNIGSFSELQAKSYDRESPCFYAAQGWRNEYGKSAWLKSSEVADIVNVILLARKDASTKEHLCQTDKPPNPKYCGEIWDEERVKKELNNRGVTSYNSVSSISVAADFGGGRTTSISINGKSFDASEFKNYFNLRAPANIQIVGPLFNVERK